MTSVFVKDLNRILINTVGKAEIPKTVKSDTFCGYFHNQWGTGSLKEHGV